MTLVISFLCFNDSSSPYLEYFLISLERALKKVDDRIIILIGDNSSPNYRDNELKVSDFFEDKQWSWQYLNFSNNLGFAAAYNHLISKARDLNAEYFLMLNPDMLIDETMIEQLLHKLKTNIELASVCPKIYYWDFENNIKTNILDSCGIILKTGLRFSDLGQGEKDMGLYDKANILGPSGAAAMFRMSALETIKKNGQYFDENFFMYKEDCDLVYRLAQANCASALVPEAIAYHDRSLSLQKGLRARIIDWQKRSKLSRTWSFKGQHLLFVKHWRNESLVSRFLIFIKIILYYIFSLFLANFLLKTYKDSANPKSLD